jgi:NADH dehydrogenase
MEGPVTVFGGTGFLGREIVRAVCAAGLPVRVATRQRPADGFFGAGSGRISHVAADVTDEISVAAAVDGASAVVNAVSLYAEKGTVTFDAVHVAGAGRVARCAGEGGAATLVHVSGLGVDVASPSRYVRARARGEDAVRQNIDGAVIIRPSVLFGRGDSLLTAIAAVTALPVVPLFGGGGVHLQPVYVDDVAAAVAKIAAGVREQAPVYELGGADVLSYRQLVEIVMTHLGRRRPLLPLPFWVWKSSARMLSLLPAPPLTIDQVILMQDDNVVGGHEATFADLQIEPAGIASLLAVCLPRRGSAAPAQP